MYFKVRVRKCQGY